MTARRAALAALAAACLSSAPVLVPAPTAAAAAVRASGPAFATAALPAPQRGLSDGRLLANADPALRAAGVAMVHRFGGTVARIPIGWSTVVANETLSRPDESVLPLSDPAHPVYRWARIDASVRDLAAGGLQPLAYLMAAPPWAQSAPRYAYATPGTWAPRPADLAAFAAAAARRYDGTYPDPLRPGQALPRIARWQTWNEPNLARYLGPQWMPVAGRPQLFSARWYRRMHAAAYAAIHARQPDAVVGLAGLAPTGADVDGAGRVGPLRFLRSLLCLGDARDRCGPPLPFDALSIHPLSVGDPDRPARAADDLALADLQPKLTTLLDDARRAGRLRPGTRPELWITELNWTSAPGVGIAPIDQQAVVGRAMLRLWLAGATIVNWQFATDPPIERTAGENRPAGLTTNAPGYPDARPGDEKPFLAGFAWPTAAIAIGRDRTLVWAALPPGGARGPATVERFDPQAGHWRTFGRVRVGDNGIVLAVVRVAPGTVVRLTWGKLNTPPVGSVVRLRLHRPDRSAATGARSRALLGIRTAIGDPAPSDPRPTDQDGPGPISDAPPLLPGGTPPTLSGRPVPPLAVPDRPLRRLRWPGTPGSDLILGSSGADRIAGSGGADLLIGLGGDDRFEASGGRTTIVRGRRIEHR